MKTFFLTSKAWIPLIIHGHPKEPYLLFVALFDQKVLAYIQPRIRIVHLVFFDRDQAIWHHQHKCWLSRVGVIYAALFIQLDDDQLCSGFDSSGDC